VQRALAGEVVTYERELTYRSAGHRFVRVTHIPDADDGSILGCFTLVVDITGAWRVREALARANERFALATEAVGSLIYDWDPLSDTVWRSRGLRDLVGYDPTEVPAQAQWWESLVHPDDRDIVTGRHVGRVPEGDRFAREYRVRHRDGRWLHVWEHGVIVRNVRGEPVRVVGNIFDVTERKRAEEGQRFLAEAGEALSASLDIEETLQTVAQLAVSGLADWCTVHLVQPDSTVVQVAVAHRDPAMVQWARDIQRRFPFDPDAPHGVARVLRTGKAVHYPEITPAMIDTATGAAELREVVRAAGLTSAMIVPMVARGATIGAIAFYSAESGHRYTAADLALAQDVARRAAIAVDNALLYAQAHAAEARFRALFEQAPDAVLVSSADGRYVEANPAATALLGYSPEEILRMRVGDFSPNPDETREGFSKLRQSGSWRGEVQVRRKDGALVPVEAWTTSVELPTGPVFVSALRDISLRKAHERFEQELLADLAHDLKNPLAATRVQAQLMRRRLRGHRLPPGALDEALAVIEDNTARMARRIDELSDIARLRAGRSLELRRAPVDLGALIRPLIAAHQQTTERHQVTLQAPPEPLIGMWDASRLERVIDNLLANAIKYSPAGGSVEVTIQRDVHEGTVWAILSVKDHGIGIPAADLTAVFDRFYRGRNVSSRSSGAGVGVAGARQIVEQHGGTITVESIEGEGSTFTVRLPLNPLPA
jgi:PAS domain S-box-containing protein